MTTALIVIAVLAVLIYLSIRGGRKSPKGSSHITVGDFQAEVRYCRPSVRNRVIFGTKEEKALLVYGKYWRLGANQATTVRFSHPVTLSGHAVPAGTYHLYAFPGKKEFELRLNSTIRAWGSMKAKPETDLCSIKVPVTHLSEPVEQLTIDFQNTDKLTLQIRWADVQLEMPVVVNA